MRTIFGLWDNQTNNLVADFDTEAEALAYVVEEIALHGRNAVMDWALLRDEENKTAMVAMGQDLVEYARGTPLQTA